MLAACQERPLPERVFTSHTALSFRIKQGGQGKSALSWDLEELETAGEMRSPFPPCPAELCQATLALVPPGIRRGKIGVLKAFLFECYTHKSAQTWLGYTPVWKWPCLRLHLVIVVGEELLRRVCGNSKGCLFLVGTPQSKCYQNCSDCGPENIQLEQMHDGTEDMVMTGLDRSLVGVMNGIQRGRNISFHI